MKYLVAGLAAFLFTFVLTYLAVVFILWDWNAFPVMLGVDRFIYLFVSVVLGLLFVGITFEIVSHNSRS